MWTIRSTHLSIATSTTSRGRIPIEEMVQRLIAVLSLKLCGFIRKTVAGDPSPIKPIDIATYAGDNKPCSVPLAMEGNHRQRKSVVVADRSNGPGSANQNSSSLLAASLQLGRKSAHSIVILIQISKISSSDVLKLVFRFCVSLLIKHYLHSLKIK